MINDGVFVTSDDRVSLHLPSLETASGSIVYITDAISRRVEELICYINPLQTGSGDPSPDNIRPISGYLGVNIFDEIEYDLFKHQGKDKKNAYKLKEITKEEFMEWLEKV